MASSRRTTDHARLIGIKETGEDGDGTAFPADRAAVVGFDLPKSFPPQFDHDDLFA